MKNIFGWIGAVCILGAYALNSFEIVSSVSSIYQILNLIGSIGIVITAYHHRDNPAMALNIVWAVIAIISLFRI